MQPEQGSERHTYLLIDRLAKSDQAYVRGVSLSRHPSLGKIVAIILEKRIRDDRCNHC